MRDDETVSTAAPNASLPLVTSTAADISVTKAAYISKFQGRGQRIEEAREAIASAEADAKQLITISHIQRCLDMTQLRLLIPLPLTAAFLSILLLALYFDGYNVSIWGCAAPLLFFVLYLLVAIVVVRFIYKKRYSASAVFNNLWDDLRSPIKTMFDEVLDESSRLSVISIIVILVCASQLVLIAVKLSPPEVISKQVTSHFHWGEVFAPMWLLFLLYCISPLIGCIQEPGIFLIGLGILWVPFFILFVCLTVKLNGQEHHSKLGKMRMALIFMPFWIIEGFVLLSTLLTFIVAVHRRRRGLLERLDEAIGQ
jgi:hypothetical protein